MFSVLLVCVFMSGSLCLRLPTRLFREALFPRTVTAILAMYILRVAEVHKGLPWSVLVPDID